MNFSFINREYTGDKETWSGSIYLREILAPCRWWSEMEVRRC